MTLLIDSAATFCSCTQLRWKTLDLNKAGEKHYQLEQELAFYKIDSKFHNLTDIPQTCQNEVSYFVFISCSVLHIICSWSLPAIFFNIFIFYLYFNICLLEKMSNVFVVVANTLFKIDICCFLVYSFVMFSRLYFACFCFLFLFFLSFCIIVL